MIRSYSPSSCRRISTGRPCRPAPFSQCRGPRRLSNLLSALVRPVGEHDVTGQCAPPSVLGFASTHSGMNASVLPDAVAILADFLPGRYAPAILGALGAACLRHPARDAVELCCHDEVVLVQTFDLFSKQRDRGIPPAEPDVRMVSLGFSQRSDALDEGKRVAKSFAPIGPLDPGRVVEHIPFRRLL